MIDQKFKLMQTVFLMYENRVYTGEIVKAVVSGNSSSLHVRYVININGNTVECKEDLLFVTKEDLLASL